MLKEPLGWCALWFGIADSALELKRAKEMLERDGLVVEIPYWSQWFKLNTSTGKYFFVDLYPSVAYFNQQTGAGAPVLVVKMIFLNNFDAYWQKSMFLVLYTLKFAEKVWKRVKTSSRQMLVHTQELVLQAVKKANFTCNKIYMIFSRLRTQ